MTLRNLIQPILRLPDDNESGNEGKNDLDIILEGDDEKKDDDNDSSDEEDETEDKDEDGEDSNEEDDDTNDEEDLESKEKDEEVNNVRLADVKTKYPEFAKILKEFPGLKQAFYRGEAFAERFVNAEAADEAVRKADQFDVLSDAVLSGNAEALLKDLETASPKGLKEFANNFLGDLQEIDESLYFEVTKPVIKNLLANVFAHGESEGDENYKKASVLISKLLGFSKSYNERPQSVELKKEKKEPDEKLERYEQQQYHKLHQQVATETFTALEKEIGRRLDPTNSIKSAGMKKLMVKQIRDEVDQLVGADNAHISRMNALWAREKRTGFSGTLKESIKSAYLSRATALMPKVLSKVRKDVLGSQKADDTKTSDKVNNRDKRLDVGREGKGKNSLPTIKEIRQKKMSDLDIINA